LRFAGKGLKLTAVMVLDFSAEEVTFKHLTLGRRILYILILPSYIPSEITNYSSTAKITPSTTIILPTTRVMKPIPLISSWLIVSFL